MSLQGEAVLGALETVGLIFGSGYLAYWLIERKNRKRSRIRKYVAAGVGLGVLQGTFTATTE
jgi:hypothetical protein